MAKRGVSWSQEPELLLQRRLGAAALQVDQRLGLQQHAALAPASPLLLVPAIEEVDSVVQLGAGLLRACGAGKLEVNRVNHQALLSKAGVLGQGGEQFMHHGAGVPTGVLAQDGCGAAAPRAAALTEVRHGRGRHVAAQAVGPDGQAGGGLAYSAAHPLHGQHGGRLGGLCVSGEVHVDGRCGDDPVAQTRSSSIFTTAQMKKR